MKQVIAVITIVVVLLSIVVGIQRLVTSGDVSNIRRYAEDNGFVVESIDHKIFSFGPYWTSKDRRIYQVFTTDKREYWFRFGNLFGYDIEEKVSGKYIKRK